MDRRPFTSFDTDEGVGPRVTSSATDRRRRSHEVGRFLFFIKFNVIPKVRHTYLSMLCFIVALHAILLSPDVKCDKIIQQWNLLLINN